MSERVRTVMFGLGFSEIMSLPMTTEEDHFERFRTPLPKRYTRCGQPKAQGPDRGARTPDERRHAGAAREPPSSNAAAPLRDRQRGLARGRRSHGQP